MLREGHRYSPRRGSPRRDEGRREELSGGHRGPEHGAYACGMAGASEVERGLTCLCAAGYQQQGDFGGPGPQGAIAEHLQCRAAVLPLLPASVQLQTS